ncbi:hypothetical protein OIV83_000980 [Microbotryomycetes sp. JL201]|nr:hypothetical protein OIV83_000980 [Microbotryomycetes sp. JL201]
MQGASWPSTQSIDLYHCLRSAFLVALILLIGYLSYTVWILPSIYSLVHYANVTVLLISVVTLVLFFATGLYGEKIAYAYKFVPQANRAMRPFNIYLNTRVRSRLSWLNPFRITSTPAPPPISRQASLQPVPRSASPSSRSAQTSGSIEADSTTLRRSTSSSSSSSVASARSAGAIRSRTPSRSPSPSSSWSPVTRAVVHPAPPSVRGVPIPPIPPAQNPRGEMIFSSRVSAAFREGYERYRGEWERRRAEATRGPQAQPLWLPWFPRRPRRAISEEKMSRPSTPNNDSLERTRGRSVTGLGTGGTSTPTGFGSKTSSRHPSPYRSSPRTSRPSSPGQSRPATPSSTDATNTKDGGRIRAESFSALLQTMEEDVQGDQRSLAPSAIPR